MIYVLTSPDRAHVKIGFSGRADPVERCEEIELARPERLVLMLLLRGDWHVEKQLHQRFASARLADRQEWFQMTREIEDWLRAEAGIVTQPFFEWLLGRRDDGHPIGTFARALDVKLFPKEARSFFGVDDHLRVSGASLKVRTSFEEAWREFLREEAKKTREDEANEARSFKRDVADKPKDDLTIAASSIAALSDLFEHLLPEALVRSPERAQAINTILCFQIEGYGDWTIDCSRTSSPPTCIRGRSKSACCTVEISGSGFVAMLSDPNVGMQLYFQKKLRISGDLSHAIKIASVFELVRPA
jgi:uncharacterized protein YozE (UPF0346 family)